MSSELRRAPGVRATAVVHLATGAALLLAPRRFVGRSSSTRATPRSADLLARLLGARHVVEGLWLARTDSASAHVPAGAVEVIHVGSMAVWRPSSPALQTFARRGALVSTTLLVLHGALAVNRRTQSAGRSMRADPAGEPPRPAPALQMARA